MSATSQMLEDRIADENLRRANEGRGPISYVRHPSDLRSRLEAAEQACREACEMLDEMWMRGLNQAGHHSQK
jgi:hypothetical protein